MARAAGNRVPPAQFPAFVPIDRSFCALYIARGPSLNFDETKHIFLPSDQIDLATILRRTIVPTYDCVADLPQIEKGILLSARAHTKMRRQSDGSKRLQCTPVQHPEAATREHSKKA